MWLCGVEKWSYHIYCITVYCIMFRWNLMSWCKSLPWCWLYFFFASITVFLLLASFWEDGRGVCRHKSAAKGDAESNLDPHCCHLASAWTHKEPLRSRKFTDWKHSKKTAGDCCCLIVFCHNYCYTFSNAQGKSRITYMCEKIMFILCHFL